MAGVTRCRTVVRNLSEKPLVTTCLLDSFRFEGGDFEVYTQANMWMKSEVRSHASGRDKRGFRRRT